MNLHDLMYFAPDEPGSGGEPVEGVPQTLAAPVENEPTSPWADDLTRAFPDEGQRGQVDQFLRSTVQPYITRKEQEIGEVSKVWNQLWDEDMTFPTFLELGAQLYGPDVATTIAQSLATHFEQQGMSPEDAAAAAVEVTEDAAAKELGQQSAQSQQPPSFEEWLKQQPPEVRQYMTQESASREDKLYEEQLDAVAKTEPTINANRELFSRYVAAAEGDLDAATALWQRELAPMIREHPDVFGFEDPAAKAAAEQQAAAEAAAAQPRREAPAVLGNSSAQGTTTPPQIPAHQSLDEATDDFLADMRKNRGSAAGRV
jgi:hypothetical protein